MIRARRGNPYNPRHPEHQMGTILTLDEARAARGALHRSGQRLVFTNGCFDLLHVGHLSYLEQAAALGDALWVGLNDDESVRRLKGPRRPLIPLAERARLLAALTPVTAVIPFGEATADRLIGALAPDIYVKGGDYNPATLPEAPTARAVGAEMVMLPFVAGRSTSDIIATIVARYGESAGEPGA